MHVNVLTVAQRLWLMFAVWQCDSRLFVACKTPNVPRDCKGAALAITMTSCCYFICKCMQILLTLYICVISAQKKMSTLLYFGLHCLPYFPPHQLGMLKHSALAHSVWQRHVSSAPFCEPPCQLCFLGPQSNTEGRGPRYPSSQQDLECDLLPACMFF